MLPQQRRERKDMNRGTATLIALCAAFIIQCGSGKQTLPQDDATTHKAAQAEGLPKITATREDPAVIYFEAWIDDNWRIAKMNSDGTGFEQVLDFHFGFPYFASPDCRYGLIKEFNAEADWRWLAIHDATTGKRTFLPDQENGFRLVGWWDTKTVIFSHINRMFIHNIETNERRMIAEIPRREPADGLPVDGGKRVLIVGIDYLYKVDVAGGRIDSIALPEKAAPTMHKILTHDQLKIGYVRWYKDGVEEYVVIDTAGNLISKVGKKQLSESFTEITAKVHLGPCGKWIYYVGLRETPSGYFHLLKRARLQNLSQNQVIGAWESSETRINLIRPTSCGK